MMEKKLYYIIHGKKDNKEQYAVFNEKKKFIKSYSEDIVDKQVCTIEALKEKYKHTPDDIEIGYENEIFVYCLLYRGENSLIYAFYGIDDGEFIKAYRINNSR